MNQLSWLFPEELHRCCPLLVKDGVPSVPQFGWRQENPRVTFVWVVHLKWCTLGCEWQMEGALIKLTPPP